MGKKRKNLKKNSKLFRDEFFLDEVVSSLSLSLSLFLSSAIANQAQVFLSKIKPSSREIITNGPSVRKLHLGLISKLAATVNKLT